MRCGNALLLVPSNQTVDILKRSVTFVISNLTLSVEITDTRSAPTVQQHFGTITCLRKISEA